MAKQKTCKTPAIETRNVGAAAVDIGSREHMAAVNPDVTDAPPRDLRYRYRGGQKRRAAMHRTSHWLVPA
ncbi:MAG: hypothetical protein ABJH20_22680 [Rhizobiaceae bacterium]